MGVSCSCCDLAVVGGFPFFFMIRVSPVIQKLVTNNVDYTATTQMDSISIVTKALKMFLCVPNRNVPGSATKTRVIVQPLPWTTPGTGASNWTAIPRDAPQSSSVRRARATSRRSASGVSSAQVNGEMDRIWGDSGKGGVSCVQ